MTLREVDGRAALVDPGGVELLALTPAQATLWDALADWPDRSAGGLDAGTRAFLEELDGLGLVSDAGSTRRLTVLADAPPEEVARELRRAAEKDGALHVAVTGGSMRPRIRPDDRARVGQLGERAPRWGEVWALCHHTGLVVVLRCRGRRGGGFVFQGDAEHRAAALVTPDQLVGRVVAVERGGGSRALGARERWSRGLAGQLRHAGKRIAIRLRRATRT